MDSSSNKALGFPQTSIACILIVTLVLIASVICFFFDLGFSLQNDPQVVINQEQWYRIITSPIAILNTYEFIECLLCLLCLCFFLPVYEKKYSTVWTFYHFFKANMMIQLFYFLIFKLKVMNEATNGVAPYTFYVFLKISQNRSSEDIFKFAPFPVNKAGRSFLILCFVEVFSTQSIACLIVFSYWIMIYFPCLSTITDITVCKTFRCCNGPLVPIVFRLIEKILPVSLAEWKRFHRLVPITESELKLCSQSQQDIQL